MKAEPEVKQKWPLLVKKLVNLVACRTDSPEDSWGNTEMTNLLMQNDTESLGEEKSVKANKASSKYEVLAENLKEKLLVKKTKKEGVVNTVKKTKKEGVVNTIEQPIDLVSEKSKQIGDGFFREGGLVPVNNGARTDKYVWTQTLSDIDILIEVPDLPSKSFIVEIKRKHLKMGIKGQKLIIDSDLEKEINTLESIWSMIDEEGVEGKLMTINLVKNKEEEWWPRVCVGDPMIDTKLIDLDQDPNIDPNIDSLDDRNRMAKLMYDSDPNPSPKGLPHAKAQLYQDTLKEWFAEHPELNQDFVKCDFGGANMTR